MFENSLDIISGSGGDHRREMSEVVSCRDGGGLPLQLLWM